MHLIKSLQQINWHRIILHNQCIISLLKEEEKKTQNATIYSTTSKLKVNLPNYGFSQDRLFKEFLNLHDNVKHYKSSWNSAEVIPWTNKVIYEIEEANKNYFMI